jgi:hypothetical protein
LIILAIVALGFGSHPERHVLIAVKHKTEILEALYNLVKDSEPEVPNPLGPLESTVWMDKALNKVYEKTNVCIAFGSVRSSYI